jgi:4-hydroxythreonine-4-phosphate dehydrogenase
VIFSMGDPSGIGPEVVLKALLPLRLGQQFTMAVVGPPVLWDMAAREMGVLPPDANEVSVIVPDGYEEFDEEQAREVLFAGEFSRAGAEIALASLKKACDLVTASHGEAALVTAPINKRCFFELDETGPGHTEWLADHLGADMPVMLMVGEGLRIALATTHVPIRDVPGALSADGIVERLRVLSAGLEARFGVEQPRVAMLALNPHGGAGADADEEEKEILQPALDQARSEGLEVEGLFAADSFFGRNQWKKFDAVLAAFHDQGLVPLKMQAAGAGVNVSLGLPIVRTSPDHGTAFDIAGRGIASETSMIAAARLANLLLEGRGGG